MPDVMPWERRLPAGSMSASGSFMSDGRTMRFGIDSGIAFGCGFLRQLDVHIGAGIVAASKHEASQFSSINQ